jgi:hypothetical protein
MRSDPDLPHRIRIHNTALKAYIQLFFCRIGGQAMTDTFQHRTEYGKKTIFYYLYWQKVTIISLYYFNIAQVYRIFICNPVLGTIHHHYYLL